jgi:glycine cleavage system regulatory protein
MTVLGADRPGLVDRLASLIADHGGNWEESRMCRLGGQFAGILLVHVPEEQVSALTGALGRLEGLDVGVTPTAPPDRAAETRSVALSVVGQDRQGIVRQIAEVLARHGVNVEELHSECTSAPMSGEALFRAEARLAIDPAAGTAALQADLERIASDLMVDITIAPQAHNPRTAQLPAR